VKANGQPRNVRVALLQVLTVMLSNPSHAWRVTGLAAAAGGSLGHVSNVRAGLVDRECGRVSDKGLSLSAPDELLNAWRDAASSGQDSRPPQPSRACGALRAKTRAPRKMWAAVMHTEKYMTQTVKSLKLRFWTLSVGQRANSCVNMMSWSDRGKLRHTDTQLVKLNTPENRARRTVRSVPSCLQR
jgi:hypothetical protein